MSYVPWILAALVVTLWIVGKQLADALNLVANLAKRPRDDVNRDEVVLALKRIEERLGSIDQAWRTNIRYVTPEQMEERLRQLRPQSLEKPSDVPPEA